MKQFRSAIGGRLAQYLQRSSRKYQPFSVSDPDTLCRILEPGDVLLVEGKSVRGGDRGYYTTKELLHICHHSLFAPRDFDLSPYFRIVKPTIESRFNYQNLAWYNRSPSGDDTADNRR